MSNLITRLLVDVASPNFDSSEIKCLSCVPENFSPIGLVLLEWLASQVKVFSYWVFFVANFQKIFYKKVKSDYSAPGSCNGLKFWHDWDKVFILHSSKFQLARFSSCLVLSLTSRGVTLEQKPTFSESVTFWKTLKVWPYIGQ